MTDLLELGAVVEWTDADAAAAARAAVPAGTGRLAELVAWLAATQANYPPVAPRRARCVVLGEVDPRFAALADSSAVGVRGADVETDGVAAGLALANDEVEGGTDLLVLATGAHSRAGGVVVALLTGTEPVALLPRGADAVDTASWIERAGYLRDARRRAAPLRGRPDDLLAGVDDPALAVATGVVLGAVSRRTPLVLDGTGAVAAALLAYDLQARAGRWWRVADSSPDPVHAHAVEELAQQPVLDLGTRTGDGTAGVLAVLVLRAAAALAGRSG